MKKGTIKVSVFYPNSEGSTFDLDYYCNKHMPMVKNLLGDALKSTGVDKGLVGGTPNQPAPYSAIGHLYFDSIADFQNSFGPHAQTIMADAANYTNVQPSVQISEIQ
ncbi:MAG: EthD family reductase [Bacteroidota bacterium]